MSKRVHLIRAAVTAGLLAVLMAGPATVASATAATAGTSARPYAAATAPTTSQAGSQFANTTVRAAGKNVWEGVTPSWGPFKKIFATKTTTFLSLAWLVGFIFLAFHLIMSVAGIVRARRQGIGDELADTRKDIGLVVVAVIIMAAIPPLWLILT